MLTVLLQVFVRYRKLALILKWLTLFLFSYVIAVLLVDVPWGQVLRDLVIPKLQWSSGYWMMIVALLGTTISPYLFFWQASKEVEELRLKGKGHGTDAEVRNDLKRVKRDTYVGMFFSSAVVFFIMLLGGVVLYGAGAAATGGQKKVMGSFTSGPKTRRFGWAGVGAMSLAVVMMLWDALGQAF
jgi:Mn2+/Fe2+ NRAMP family transporter